jgi:hypothetical protein
MPLYEEKLISPLAVRFTQNRIRHTFQDGRELESTIKELAASPGEGDHDIIIDAPFPAIEIIRWAPGGRKGHSEEHWFTFDNRRLYCLQRFAVECYPKRVAAKVEVMYADSGGIRKKLDTQTRGSSVFIGHAFATEDELIRWSWRDAVQMRCPPGMFTSKSDTYIAIDEAKANLHDLADVPNLAPCTNRSQYAPLDHAAKPAEEQDDRASNMQHSEGHQNIDGASLMQHSEDHQNIDGASLTSLIGKLLTLKEEEPSQRGRRLSSSTASTQASSVLPSESDSVGSTDDLIESASSLDSTQREEVAISGPIRKKKHAGKNIQKKTQIAKMPQQNCPTNVAAAHAMQMQMLQYQRTQYQLEYAAWMARWQQAAYAFPAHRVTAPF